MRSDENYSYYEEDADAPMDVSLSKFDSAVQNIWHETNDSELDIRHRSEGASSPITPKSMTPRNPEDPVTGEESENEFQNSNDSLPDDPVPMDTLPAPRQSEPPKKLDEGAKSNSNEEGEKKNSNTFSTSSSTSSSASYAATKAASASFK